MYNFRAEFNSVAMAAPNPLEWFSYKALALETLAMGVVMEHRFDTSVLPDTIKADLEKQRRLAGRYRITHVGMKVEGGEEPLTEEQWDNVMDGMQLGHWPLHPDPDHAIGDWMGGYITLTESADGRSWDIRDPDYVDGGRVPVLLGLGQVLEDKVKDNFFENGALKEHTFHIWGDDEGDDDEGDDDEGDDGGWKASVWCEWKLTRADELTYTRKDHFYDEELDLELIFAQTFLARRTGV
jgi:hypothetical protein